MKKLITLILALAMVCSMAACGGTASSSESSASSAAAAESETESAQTAVEADTVETDAAAEEASEAETVSAAEETETGGGALTDALADTDPVELPLTEDNPEFELWMCSPGVVSQTDDFANVNEAYKTLQERTGITLTFIMGNFETQSDEFNLMAAAGNFPAILNGAANLYTSGPDAAIEEEIFVDLTDYIEEYAPHYYALITADESIMPKVTTPEGAMAAFYSLYDDSKYGLEDKGMLIRLDYLEDAGLEMPTTYDELHDALAAFQETEGTKATLALPTSGLSDFLLGGYGVGQTFYVEDGTIKFAPMEQGFRDYLETMSQWYAEGLIYADYYNYTNDIMFDGTDLIGSGDVAVFYNETGVMSSYADYSDDPDFTLAGMAPVSLEEGGTVYMTEKTPSYVDNSRWTITTNCEDVELIVQVADYLYSEEGILLANYGVEDVSYTLNDEGEPEFGDLIMNNPDGYAYRDALALHTIDGIGTVYDPLRGATNYTELQLSSWDDWTNANIDYSRALPSKDLLNMDETSQYASLYSDIETFLDEAIAKYIIGDYSFDDYETDFIAKLESMDIQTCIDLYQTAYDRYMENHA